MPAAHRSHRFETVAKRWHDLSQRRLADYADMYNSGRWRLFYAGEEEFALNVIEMIKTNNRWAQLAGREEMAATAPAALSSKRRRRAAA